VERAAALAASLAKTVNSIADRLNALATYGRRNRTIIIGLTVSVLLDVSLSVFTIFLAIGLAHANSKNETIHQSQLTACANQNMSRALQVQVWNHLLGLSSTNKETPAEKEQTASFKSYISGVYSPYDCAKLYSLGG